MKYTLKSRHSTVVEESIRGIGEPVRGLTPKGGAILRGICTKYLKKTAAVSLEWFSGVMKTLQTAYEARLAEYFNGKSFGGVIESEFTYGHTYACGCGECATKDISDSRANELQRRFRETFGAAVDDKLKEQAKAFLLKMMNTGKVSPKESKALMQDMYFDTIIAALDDAYSKGYESWKQQPEDWKKENPFQGKKTSVFDRDDTFVKEIYNNGYKLVSHSITVENLAGIREIMNNSLNKGLSWNETAYLLNRRFGTVIDESTGLVRGGGISHWQRVVRTEMATAIDKAHHDRYLGMGGQFVKMSVSPTACPICLWYRQQNGGIYPMDQAPDITEDTHPNCRCTFVILWSVPRGINENHVFIPYPDSKGITIEMIRKGNFRNPEMWIAKFTDMKMLN